MEIYLGLEVTDSLEVVLALLEIHWLDLLDFLDVLVGWLLEDLGAFLEDFVLGFVLFVAFVVGLDLLFFGGLAFLELIELYQEKFVFSSPFFQLT